MKRGLPHRSRRGRPFCIEKLLIILCCTIIYSIMRNCALAPFLTWRTNGTFKKLKEGIEDGSFREMWREAKWMFVYNDFFSENYYMKKPVCLLLVFVLAFVMSAGAFAENVVSPEKDNTNVDVDDEPSSSPGAVTAARFAMSLPQCFLRSELLHLV